MENVTLKRISEVLGLSISTVSRALKNHPDISAVTKKRVTEIAQFLDYEPNLNAINLRSKKNRVLGLIVPSVSGFFYDSFISAVEEECRAHDYSLMILQSGNDPEIEKKNLVICRQNRVSGLFVCLSIQTAGMEAFDKFIEADIPLIFFDKVPEGKAYNKVCIADEKAAVLASQLLLKKNKKRILAIFGDNKLLITRTRLAAFNNATKRQQAATYIEHCQSTAQAREVTQRYFSKKEFPDALFCMSDEILIGAMKCLNTLGIKIPGQTSVIALSDGFLPYLYTPEISYIKTSGYELGKLSFTKMMKCLNGEKEPTETFTTASVVEGGSL